MTLRLPGCVLVALGSSSAIVNHDNEAHLSPLFTAGCQHQASQPAMRRIGVEARVPLDDSVNDLPYGLG